MDVEPTSSDDKDGGAVPFFKQSPSPFVSVVIISVAIFTVETTIMFAEDHFKFLSDLEWNILDAVTLVLVTNPILYFLVYKPLARTFGTKGRHSPPTPMELDRRYN